MVFTSKKGNKKQKSFYPITTFVGGMKPKNSPDEAELEIQF